MRIWKSLGATEGTSVRASNDVSFVTRETLPCLLGWKKIFLLKKEKLLFKNKEKIENMLIPRESEIIPLHI